MLNLKQYKYLIIGIVLSVLFHSILFFSLNLLTKKPEKQKKEKEIFIKILPSPETKKISEKEKVKKKKQKGLPEKKQKKKIFKKIVKNKKQVIKRKKVKKEPLEKKKQIKPKPKSKEKKVSEKKLEIAKKIEKKTQLEKKEVKNIEQKKFVEIPEEKKIEIPEIDVTEQIEKELKKEIKIPENLFGLKGKKEKTKIAKDKEVAKKKKKEIEDYLKYIKEEFEKNKFYPLRARKLGIEGTVVIRFTILPDGTIDTDSIKIVYSDSPILSYGAKRIFEKIKKIRRKPPNNKKLTVEIPIEYILIEVY